MKAGVSPREIASKLSEEYPAESDVISRALAETVEHVNGGFPVPSNRRITVEDWGEFVLIHVNFGSLTNRALAQLLGQLISEKLGFTAVVQHDPYRVFVQTMGSMNAEGVVRLFGEMTELPAQTVRDSLVLATVKTGLFKRRMIHVARRFGALKKWADFSSVSLQKLVKSFEGTPIYEEALKEVFTKDLDVENLVRVLGLIHGGEVVVTRIDNGGKVTPIARVGVERISMKTDLIPPERMRAVLIESAKARLLSEAASFVCVNCWGYVEMLRAKDLPDRPKCPKCASHAIGLLKVEEERALPLVDKEGTGLTKSEEKLREHAVNTARLIEKYGRPAAVALLARKVTAAEIMRVLEKEQKLTDRFYELVLEEERKAISKRFY
jgi:ATP-dependent Lhr-like helicase